MSDETEDSHLDEKGDVHPFEIDHEELRLLLFWKGKTIHQWTDDDVRLAHLIRRRHYHPKEEFTEEDKALLGRVISDRSKNGGDELKNKIHGLSTIKMWIPHEPQQ